VTRASPRPPRRVAPDVTFDVTSDVTLDECSPRAAREGFLSALRGGAVLAPVGLAEDDPGVLLEARTLPRARLTLFGWRVYLSRPLFDPHLGFMVAYVGRCTARGREPRRFVPRVFYKDISLVWRCATHVIHTPEEDWIGKGAVRWRRDGEDLVAESAEETTDLPYEVQAALDAASRAVKPVRDDSAALLVLRNAPAGRLAPYRDFTGPRARAQRTSAIHGARPVARFRRPNVPESLEFARGYAPDLAGGCVSRSVAASNLYGGTVHKTRILSENRRIQYQFSATPTHVWLNPPQALTTELTPYLTRTLDVHAPSELFVPGFEYHFVEDGVEHSQIPGGFQGGFAGAPSSEDPMRADTSAWLERLAPVREYRRRFGVPRA